MSAGLPSLGLQSGMIPRVTPPISVPFRPLIAPLLLLPLALNLIDRAGGGQFRDGQLAKLGKSYDPNSGLSKPYFGGQVTDGIREQGAPPFSGGQSVGIEYVVTVKATFSGGEIQFSRGRNPANSIAELQESTKNITGPISGASVDSPDNFGTVYYRVNGALQS